MYHLIKFELEPLSKDTPYYLGQHKTEFDINLCNSQDVNEILWKGLQSTYDTFSVKKYK